MALDLLREGVGQPRAAREGRMADHTTIFAGIPIPSNPPIFLSAVGFHVAAGIASTITGAVAMLSTKGRGQHSTSGTVYYWCLSAVFASASALSILVRRADDYHLFILGALSFAVASCGRTAFRQHWRGSIRLHVMGMGASLSPSSDCVLRGQRKEPAALEGASSDCILVAAERRRYPADRLRVAATSGGPARHSRNSQSRRNHSLFKLVHYPGRIA